MPPPARPPLPEGPYLVVGLGRSGQSIATVLAQRGAGVIAVDRSTPDPIDVPDSVDVRLAEDGQTALDEVSAVICSPGVPDSAPVLVAACEMGLPVLSELECAWRLTEVPVVAITGTNGKTTTTELLAHLMREAGVRAVAVGNVGTPYSSIALTTADAPELAVCEVSSFQLEAAAQFAPDIAVLLNLGSDHLDRHGSIETYHDLKLSLFANQRTDQVAVLPASIAAQSVPGRAERLIFGPEPTATMQITDQSLVWQGEPLLERAALGLPGPQNAENAAAAATAALAWGIGTESVAAALSSFRGVPHRLETVAERDGVLWVNDSKATNVTAAAVALRSFGERPVHVILGGSGKGEDYGPLREPLSAYAVHAYAIGEQAVEIATVIDDIVPVTVSQTLERAVADARARVRSGDVILLAPACASFDQFRDFEHRGQVFSDLARTPV